MANQPGKIHFQMPAWIEGCYSLYVQTTDLNKRMEFVIDAARLNVENESGGPFAAAVFEIKSGKLISLGVNLVTTQGMSILHAEMVAIAIAQKKLGVYDLGGESMPEHELVSSSEPCAMCFGAIPWSGVTRLVTGAIASDAAAIGFDEGPKPSDWTKRLESRGIKVITEVEGNKAKDVLNLYLDSGGHIYNSREG